MIHEDRFLWLIDWILDGLLLGWYQKMNPYQFHIQIITVLFALAAPMPLRSFTMTRPSDWLTPPVEPVGSIGVLSGPKPIDHLIISISFSIIWWTFTSEILLFSGTFTIGFCMQSWSWLRMDTQSFFASKVPKQRIEKVNDVLAPTCPLNVTSSEVHFINNITFWEWKFRALDRYQNQYIMHEPNPYGSIWGSMFYNPLPHPRPMFVVESACHGQSMAALLGHWLKQIEIVFNDCLNNGQSWEKFIIIYHDTSSSSSSSVLNSPDQHGYCLGGP